MGQVFRAYDTTTGRVVALKVLPQHLAEDREFQQRFRREARTAASLNDPNIVPIHGYGEINGQLYVDMRLIEGRDLAAYIVEKGGRLSPSQSVAVVEQVAGPWTAPTAWAWYTATSSRPTSWSPMRGISYTSSTSGSRAPLPTPHSRTAARPWAPWITWARTLLGHNGSGRRRVFAGLRAVRVPDRTPSLPRQQHRRTAEGSPGHPAAKTVDHGTRHTAGVRRGDCPRHGQKPRPAISDRAGTRPRGQSGTGRHAQAERAGTANTHRARPAKGRDGCAVDRRIEA